MCWSSCGSFTGQQLQKGIYWQVSWLEKSLCNILLVKFLGVGDRSWTSYRGAGGQKLQCQDPAQAADSGPFRSTFCRCRGNFFHTNCSNVWLVFIDKAEMSYPFQKSQNIHKMPKNLWKRLKISSLLQRLPKISQNPKLSYPKFNLAGVATTTANQ